MQHTICFRQIVVSRCIWCCCCFIIHWLVSHSVPSHLLIESVSMVKATETNLFESSNVWNIYIQRKVYFQCNLFTATVMYYIWRHYSSISSITAYGFGASFKQFLSQYINRTWRVIFVVLAAEHLIIIKYSFNWFFIYARNNSATSLRKHLHTWISQHRSVAINLYGNSDDPKWIESIKYEWAKFLFLESQSNHAIWWLNKTGNTNIVWRASSINFL